MDWLELLFDKAQEYISIPYLLIFMFLSYLVKTYLGQWLQKITKFEWKTVYTVLILASVVAVPFLLLTDEGWIKIAITYCVGTSAHELLFSLIEKKFVKK